jgi:hypothetical protein
MRMKRQLLYLRALSIAVLAACLLRIAHRTILAGAALKFFAHDLDERATAIETQADELADSVWQVYYPQPDGEAATKRGAHV